MWITFSELGNSVSKSKLKFYCRVPSIIFEAFEYITSTLSLIAEKGVKSLNFDLSFDFDEAGKSQKEETQIRKITPVIEAETIKAIIFFSAEDFFLSLSKKLNMFMIVKKSIK